MSATWSVRARLARTGLALLVTFGFILAACGGDDGDKAAKDDTTEEPAGGAGSDGGQAEEADSAVTIKGFIFKPSPLQVKAGTRVTWTNEDQIQHTVTSGTPGSKDGKFDGTLDGAGKTFTFTFDSPGTYAYFCDRHNSMTGEVVVS